MSRLLAALGRALRWLAAHWYVPLVAVVGVLAFFAGSRRGSGARRTPIADVRRELEVIRAGTEAKVAEVERGTDEAVREIDERKAKNIDELDERQAAKAARLRRDPRALARYLERVGGG